MSATSSVPSLSDDDVVALLRLDLREGDHVLSRIVQRLVEVEERRIHLKEGCSSMFEFCTEKLGLSAGSTQRRLTAARLVKRFPELLEALRDGRIHLVAIGLLKDVFTEANVSSVIERVRGKNQKQLEYLVAELRPRPDAPSLIRRLPQRAATATDAPETAPARTGTSSPEVESNGRTASDSADSASVLPIEGSTMSTDEPSSPSPWPRSEQHSARATPAGTPPPPESNTRPTASLNGRTRSLKRFEPLSPGRNKVQFMATDLQRARLEYAIDLMSHANPMGDLAPVIDAALDLLIPELEKRFGITDKPQRAERPSKDPSYFSRTARRQIVGRDGHQCSFVSAKGERCTARAFLQIDHKKQRARGGKGTVENGRPMCGPHNRFLAEQAFGRAKVAEAIGVARRKSAARKRERVCEALGEMGFDAKTIAIAIDGVSEIGWARPRKELLREVLDQLSYPRAAPESDGPEGSASNDRRRKMGPAG